MTKLSPTLMAVMLLVGTANLHATNGNELLNDLGAEESFNRGFALGYILGVVEGWDKIEPDDGNHKFCIPIDSVTHGQLQDIVKKYLADNPGERHFSAESLVRSSMAESFPC